MKRLILIGGLLIAINSTAQIAGPMPDAESSWKNSSAGHEHEILFGTAYNFTYKQKLNVDQYWFRVGAGFNWSGGPTYKLRAGVEVKERFKRHPKWGYFYGADAIHQRRKETEVSTGGAYRTTTDTRQSETGVGAGLGIEFHWGNRIATGFEIVPAIVVGRTESDIVRENTDTGDVTVDRVSTPYLGLSRSFDRSGLYIAIKF